MLSLPFDKRAYALVNCQTPHSLLLSVSFGFLSEFTYRVFADPHATFRGTASFFLSSRNCPRRHERFTLRANSRSTRVKASIASRRKYECATRRQGSSSLLFLLLSWVFNRSRVMVEFRIDNGRDSYEGKKRKEFLTNGKFLNTISECVLRAVSLLSI